MRRSVEGTLGTPHTLAFLEWTLGTAVVSPMPKLFAQTGPMLPPRGLAEKDTKDRVIPSSLANLNSKGFRIRAPSRLSITDEVADNIKEYFRPILTPAC